MLVPIKWMKDYVDINVNTRELLDALTLSGSHVDSLISADHGIKKIVVGKILEIEAHPKADKLVVTKIDIGNEILTIVTGAKNVFEGALVPVSVVGAVLGNGEEIKDHEFMGINSQGMLCSHEELGFDDSVIPKLHRDGILIISEDVKPGTDIKEVLGMDDEIIEFEITPNRADCTSIIGMAREAAASLNLPLKESVIEMETVPSVEGQFNGIEIETDRCSRLYARVMTDVKIGESPIWLQNYLMKAGMRPINNIVDITNFVMLEYGQPLHAYDLDKLSGRRLIVRQALAGETIKCIDANVRDLTTDDIVIADENGPIGIAGVMGGFDSEVTDETVNILLESAAFDKNSIRKTSKRLVLRSEASGRFEKGISSDTCETAADRACQLASSIGAAKISSAKYDVYMVKPEKKVIKLRYSRNNDMLGIDLSKAEIISLLERLFLVVEDRGEYAEVTIPHFRQDLSIEVDLIEEVGRLYGFHNIAPKKLVGQLIEGELSEMRIIENRIKQDLYALGFLEALTYSFISPRANERSGITDESGLNDFVKLLNPLGEEYSVMRTSLVPNMLDILSKNINYKADCLRVYELGNVFFKTGQGELPAQRRRLCIGIFGAEDFYSLKATVKTLLDSLGISDIRYTANSQNPTYHAGRCADLTFEDLHIGTLGEVSYQIKDEYDLSKRVYLCELDVDIIVKLANLGIQYKKILKYPKVVRDIALIVDRNLETVKIEEAIKSVNSDIIAEVRLFDVYTGDQIELGKKSLAYQVIYQASDRTLVDAEVNETQEKIMGILKTDLGAVLRS